jgi:release factor glutamine methyltransferase
LCAGAGHIGLLAAVLTGRSPLVQVDLNPNAGAFACRNAMAAGVTEHDFRIASLDTALQPDERFPLILADPPYLPSQDVSLFPDDPIAAIDGGHDGLALIDACLRLAGTHLVDNGVLFLQVRGPSQADEVGRRVGANGMCVTETRVVDNDRAVAKLQRV